MGFFGKSQEILTLGLMLSENPGSIGNEFFVEIPDFKPFSDFGLDFQINLIISRFRSLIIKQNLEFVLI